MDLEPPRRPLLLPFLQIRLQRVQKRPVPGPIVLGELGQVSLHELDQAVVVDSSQQPRQPQFGNRDHLAGAAEPRQRLQHRLDLPIGGLHRVQGVDRRAEPDGDAEPWLPVGDPFFDLSTQALQAPVDIGLAGDRQERHDAVRASAQKGPRIGRPDHGRHPPQVIALEGLDQVLRQLP